MIQRLGAAAVQTAADCPPWLRSGWSGPCRSPSHARQAEPPPPASHVRDAGVGPALSLQSPSRDLTSHDSVTRLRSMRSAHEDFPFIARENELAALQSAYRGHAAHSGRSTGVAGSVKAS